MSEAPLRECGSVFRYDAGPEVSAVALAGEWSDFSQTADAMQDADGDGVWELALELEPGAYGYKFVVDGEWRFDPDNPAWRMVRGELNSKHTVADCAQPALELLHFELSAQGRLDAVVQYYDSAAGAGWDPEALEVRLNGASVDGVVLDARRGRIGITAEGLPPGKHRLELRASDRAGVAAAPLRVSDWVEATPFAWEDAMLYFVFTDRFVNGDTSNDAPVADVPAIANYQGGDFQGVVEAIEAGWFDALGVRALWLSPVEPNPQSGSFAGTDGRSYTGYHGYWPIGSRDAEPRFGGLPALRKLVEVAHAHGLRVLLDLVLNHVHAEHPYFEQNAGWFNGDGSCVCGGANCGWEERALDCWFADYLPDWDWRRQEVEDQLIDDALFWATELDVDGFRVDAVKHFERLAVRNLRARIEAEIEHRSPRSGRRVGPHFYLVGETFTGEDGRPQIGEYLGAHDLDGQFDFPLLWPALRVFARDEADFRGLEQAVRANEAFYAPGTLNSPFIGNHDIPRFMSHAAGQIGDLFGNGSKEQGWTAPPPPPDTRAPYERQALGLAWVMTQPGVPLLYYGDEIGLPGAGDPDNRRMMRGVADPAALSEHEAWLLEQTRRLGGARQEIPALRQGGRTPLIVEPELYGYARGEDGEAAIVLLRRHGRGEAVVYLPAQLGLGDPVTFEDVGSQQRFVATGGAMTVPMASMQWRILRVVEP